MKKVVTIVVIGALVFLGLCSGAFSAGHGGYHGHGGYYGYRGYYGHGWYGGWYGFYPFGFYSFGYYPYGYPYPSYAYPYPYYPYTYSQPPVYIEPEQPFYWYYCQDPQGYYPYIESCPSGWTRVTPTPPPPGREGEVK